MNGSWHLGKLAGVDLRIHWSFLLLPLWIYASSLASGSGAVAATVAVLFVLAIFACVVLHELGHALTARQFGIPTRDITLLPIGGLASLERMPRSPWQELAIALAGPAVNVIIAAVLFAGLNLVNLPGTATVGLAAFLDKLAWVNIALVVFNMLPAFPMDGGRVLRATLALALPYTRATRVAAKVGQLMAVLLGLLGLASGNLMLVLVAGFIFLAARAEANIVVGAAPVAETSHGSSTVRRGELLPALEPNAGSSQAVVYLPVVSGGWRAGLALDWLSTDAVDEFLVASHGRIIGIVKKIDLRSAVQAGRGTWAVEQLLAMHLIPYRGLQQ